MMRKFTVIAAMAGALAVAVPAVAQADKGGKPSGSTNSKSHKCKPHNIAYVESGTISSSTLVSSNGTWSGMLVVNVTKTNHAARGDKGKAITYTFTNSNVRVRMDNGVTSLTTGDRVQLIGKIATVAKTCPALNPAATPVIGKVVVHTPAK